MADKKRIKLELTSEQRKLIAEQLGVDWDALLLSREGFDAEDLKKLGGEQGQELNIVVAMGQTRTIS